MGDILYVSFLDAFFWKRFWFSYLRVGGTEGGERFPFLNSLCMARSSWGGHCSGHGRS